MFSAVEIHLQGFAESLQHPSAKRWSYQLWSY